MKLFANGGKIDTVPIQELTCAVLGNKSTIRLPIFQRDAVWNETQAELLQNIIKKVNGNWHLQYL